MKHAAPEPALERYLRRATRGLWGQRRAELRAELEEHVLELAWSFEVAGLEPGAAMKRALERLGAPQAVSAGMVRVYAAPAFARTVLVLLAFAGGGLALFFSLGARVQAVGGIEPVMQENLQGVRLETLEQSLTPLGVRVERADGRAIVSFPDLRGPVTLEPDRLDDGSAFVTTADLVRALAKAPGAALRLDGWQNPRLSVGTTAFTLSGATGYALWAALLGERLMLEGFAGFSAVRASSDAPELGRFDRLELRVPVPDGTILALVTAPRPIAPGVQTLELDLSPAQHARATLFASTRPKRFARSLEHLGPGEAALLALSGRIGPRGPEYRWVERQ